MRPACCNQNFKELRRVPRKDDKPKRKLKQQKSKGRKALYLKLATQSGMMSKSTNIVKASGDGIYSSAFVTTQTGVGGGI